MRTLPILLVVSMFAAGCSSGVTVNQLQNQKDARLEASGYNVCMQHVEQLNQQAAICTRAKLAERGYDDGVDCIHDREAHRDLCDTPRYNAEIQAGNECDPPVTELNELDCMQLLAQ